MRLLVYIFLLGILASCSTTSGDLTRAVKKGKNSQNIYQANFGKLTKAEEVEDWLAGLGYVLVSYKQGEVARFGGYEKGIVGARFMSNYDYDRMVAEERKRQLAYQKSMRNANQQRASNNLIKGGAILAGGYVLFKGLSSLFSSSSSSTSNNYTSSSSSSPSITEMKAIICKNCTKNHYARVYRIKCSSYNWSDVYHCDRGGIVSGTGYYDLNSGNDIHYFDLDDAKKKICK